MNKKDTFEAIAVHIFPPLTHFFKDENVTNCLEIHWSVCISSNEHIDGSFNKQKRYTHKLFIWTLMWNLSQSLLFRFIDDNFLYWRLEYFQRDIKRNFCNNFENTLNLIKNTCHKMLKRTKKLLKLLLSTWKWNLNLSLLCTFIKTIFLYLNLKKFWMEKEPFEITLKLDQNFVKRDISNKILKWTTWYYTSFHIELVSDIESIFKSWKC